MKKSAVLGINAGWPFSLQLQTLETEEDAARVLLCSDAFVKLVLPEKEELSFSES